MRIFISAGEASGDLYAARLVEVLKSRHPGAEFFGCAGPRMQAAGVRPIVDQRSLAVVGIIEVIPHIPRILGEMRKKDMIEVEGTAYRLAWGVRRDIETVFQSEQLAFDESLWS